jgi:GNAT superfamily N-acetyltransferase
MSTALDVSLTPFSEGVVAADALFGLYAQLLRPYVEPVFGWDEAFQRARVTRKYPVSSLQLVWLEDIVTGCVAVTHRAESLRLSLILVSADFQGLGIGATVVRRLLDEAASGGSVLTVSCFRRNEGAIRFYERLGLTRVGGDTHFVEMKSAAPVFT